MNKGLRLGTAVAGMALVLGVAGMAVAQMAPPQIDTRQKAMKGNGAAAKTLTWIVKGETPWDQKAVIVAVTDINTTAKEIPSLFPKGSGPESGAKTAALPAIWTDFPDFTAKAKALEEASGKMLQLAMANDEAGVKAQFPVVGKACGGCHETYRAKPPQ